MDIYIYILCVCIFLCWFHSHSIVMCLYHGPKIKLASKPWVLCTISERRSSAIKHSIAGQSLCSVSFERVVRQDLCDKPLGAADYLAIGSAFHTIFIADIPRLTMQDTLVLLTLVEFLSLKRSWASGRPQRGRPTTPETESSSGGPDGDHEQLDSSTSLESFSVSTCVHDVSSMFIMCPGVHELCLV